MKTDKQIKDISDRLNAISNGNGIDDSYGLLNKHDDDDYYLDIESYPTRFTYYRHARWDKLDDGRKEKCIDGYDIDNTITQDELEYNLKLQLRISPQERYKREKKLSFP